MRTHLTTTYRDRIVTLPIDDVTHFTSGDKYVTAHHFGGELIISDTLKDLGDEFSADFIRVHRSHLVRKTYVLSFERIDNKCSQVHLANGSTLPVGRTHRDKTKTVFTAGEQ